MIESESHQFGPKNRLPTPVWIWALLHAVATTAAFVYWATDWMYPFSWFSWDGLMPQAALIVAAWGSLLALSQDRRRLAAVLLLSTSLAPWGFIYLGPASAVAIGVTLVLSSRRQDDTITR